MLDQSIIRMSPFQETGHYHIEKDGIAEVWVWDESRRLDVMKSVGNNVSGVSFELQRLKVIPETLLFEQCFSGKITRPLAEGAEFQSWDEGRLANSFWQAGSRGEVKLTPPKTESWLEKVSLNASSVEPILWRIGLWFLFLLLVYQFGGYLGRNADIKRYEQQYLEATVSASDIMATRNEARRERQLSRDLASWFSQPLQMRVLAEFDSLIPKAAVFKRWTYEDRRLNVTIFDPNLNNRAYIENLEGSQLFANVRIEPGVLVNTADIELEVIF